MRGSRYKEGQVWTYHTRPGEGASRVHIVRIDPDDGRGAIYHIYVDRLALKSPLMSAGVQDILPHAPVSAASLDASVVGLVETRTSGIPDISKAYAAWREAFDRGRGGVFTLPVSRIVQRIEDIVNGRAAEA